VKVWSGPGGVLERNQPGPRLIFRTYQILEIMFEKNVLCQKYFLMFGLGRVSIKSWAGSFKVPGESWRGLGQDWSWARLVLGESWLGPG
jgi:hypothetical protein